MTETLTDEKRQLLTSFVDSLPITPGLDEEEIRFLDSLCQLILKTPLCYWWFNLHVLSGLVEMWRLKFQGTEVDYMTLQTLLRRLFRQHSKVVIGMYEVVHRKATIAEEGHVNQVDLYQFQCHRENALAAINYRAELLGEKPMDVAA